MTRYFTSSDSIVTSRRREEIQSTSEMTPYFTITENNKLFITYLTRSTERLPSLPSSIFNHFDHFNDGSYDYGIKKEAGVPYAARFTAAVKISLTWQRFSSRIRFDRKLSESYFLELWIKQRVLNYRKNAEKVRKKGLGLGLQVHVHKPVDYCV